MESDEFSSDTVEEDDSSDSDFKDNADQLLYPGSPITVTEHILSLLSLLLQGKRSIIYCNFRIN